MADHASAIKRIRQNKKIRARNSARKSSIRTAMKKVDSAIEKGNKTDAQTALKLLTPLLARAGQSRLYHPKNTSRNISRFTKRVNALK